MNTGSERVHGVQDHNANLILLGENAQLLGSDEEFFGDDTERQIIAGVYDESSTYGLAGMDE